MDAIDTLREIVRIAELAAAGYTAPELRIEYAQHIRKLALEGINNSKPRRLPSVAMGEDGTVRPLSLAEELRRPGMPDWVPAKAADELERQAAEIARLEADVEWYRKGLQFYADGNHAIFNDEMAWDTVSGEPQNYWCDEAGTATVEDGTIAKKILEGWALPDDLDNEGMIPPADHSAPAVAPAAPAKSVRRELDADVICTDPNCPDERRHGKIHPAPAAPEGKP
jgi:hypothetical protein